MARWLIAWGGTPLGYDDDEVALIGALIAKAEAGTILPSQAARQWTTLAEMKTLLKAQPLLAPEVEGRVKPCVTPTQCGINGCIGICVEQRTETETEPDEAASLGHGFHESADGDLFFPPDQVEAFEQGRLTRE